MDHDAEPDQNGHDLSNMDAAHKNGGSSNDLAFLAPTAPLACNHDEEVEWAKAADTVDDVLGDFF